jgi:hypothetical protein
MPYVVTCDTSSYNEGLKITEETAQVFLRTEAGTQSLSDTYCWRRTLEIEQIITKQENIAVAGCSTSVKQSEDAQEKEKKSTLRTDTYFTVWGLDALDGRYVSVACECDSLSFRNVKFLNVRTIEFEVVTSGDWIEIFKRRLPLERKEDQPPGVAAIATIVSTFDDAGRYVGHEMKRIQ